jgi:DNA-binding NarL/FixJ family response regulator
MGSVILPRAKGRFAMHDTVSPVLKVLVFENQDFYKFLYASLPLDDAEIVGIYASLEAGEAARRIAEHHPDIVIVGSSRLDAATVDMVTDIRRRYPSLGVSILLFACTSGETDIIRKIAIDGEGGLAVFLRESLKDLHQFSGILRSVQYGQRIFDPVLSGYIFSANVKPTCLSDLTSRELETLGLLADGYNNHAIAEMMFIDVKTVEHHLNNIYAKLKSTTDFEKRHPRVAASRLYFQEINS